ncbi:MAG: VOC family protein [Deltaproteobacteria bacterium]|nr:VOC family protein [Deltaproteobacteria bacterium]
MFVEKIERISIAVKDLDKSIQFFSDLLGIHFDETFVVEQSGAREAISSFGLELVEGKPGTWVHDFIQKKGEGVFSLMIKVSDMEKAKKVFKDKGVRLTGEINSITEPGGPGLREVSYHPKDTHGVMIFLTEYTEKHPATIAALERREDTVFSSVRDKK